MELKETARVAIHSIKLSLPILSLMVEEVNGNSHNDWNTNC